MSDREFCESSKLGKRLATYEVSTQRKATDWTFFGTSLVVALLIVHRMVGIAALSSHVGFLSLMVLATGGAAFTVYRRGRRRIHLHQLGIRHQGIWAEKCWCWDDICEVVQSPLYVRNSRGMRCVRWKLRIRHRKGNWTTFQGYENVKSLAARTEEMLLRRLIVNYQTLFLSGATLRFGKKVAINCEGIAVGPTSLSWFDVSDIFLDEEDGIRVGHRYGRDHWLHVPLHLISNYQLLIRMLRWVKSTRARLQEANREYDDEEQIPDDRSSLMSDGDGSSALFDRLFSDNGIDLEEPTYRGYLPSDPPDLVYDERSRDDQFDRQSGYRRRSPK